METSNVEVGVSFTFQFLPHPLVIGMVKRTNSTHIVRFLGWQSGCVGAGEWRRDSWEFGQNGFVRGHIHSAGTWGDERVFFELSQRRECVGGSKKLHPASSQGSYSTQICQNPNSTAGIIFFKITSFTHRVTLLQVCCSKFFTWADLLSSVLLH